MRLINVVGRSSPFGTIRTDRTMWSSLKKVLPHLTKLFRDVFQAYGYNRQYTSFCVVGRNVRNQPPFEKAHFCEISRFFGKFDFVNTHVGEQPPQKKIMQELHLSKPTVIDWCGFLREVSEVFISTFLKSCS